MSCPTSTFFPKIKIPYARNSEAIGTKYSYFLIISLDEQIKNVVIYKCR